MQILHVDWPEANFQCWELCQQEKTFFEPAEVAL